MTFEEIKQETKAVFERYLARVEQYPDEVFMEKPDEGAWSLSQVYAHVMGSVKYYFLPHALEAFQQVNGQTGGDKSGAGKRVFELNGFPDTKIQQPGSLTNAAGPKPKSKEQVKEQLPQMIAMLGMAQMPAGSFNPEYKVEHALLGWLNGEEWLKANLWHWQHHERQLSRLESHFGIGEQSVSNS